MKTDALAQTMGAIDDDVTLISQVKFVLSGGAISLDASKFKFLILAGTVRPPETPPMSSSSLNPFISHLLLIGGREMDHQ